MSASFKKPDLNAPRFRPRSVNILTRNLLSKFKEKYPEHKDLSLKRFKAIVRTFNGNLSQGVIDNRDGVELPEGLGYVFIGTCPAAQKRNIDMQKSAEYGQIVSHKNWDSDNKLMKIFYTNHTSKYSFQNKQAWAFKAVKQFRQNASATYKQEWAKYIVVDNKKKVSAMFAKLRKKDYIVSRAREIPEGYDEFKM